MNTSQVGPWVKDKLDRLGKYLNAYTTIMRRQEWCEVREVSSSLHDGLVSLFLVENSNLKMLTMKHGLF